MRRVKIISVLNEMKNLKTEEVIKEVSVQCTEGAGSKHFTFWATDAELERMGDRYLELAGVELEDELEPEVEEPTPTGPGSRLLNGKEPENLHRALGKFGCTDHYTFATQVMGRRITTFTNLTVAASMKVYGAAVLQYGTKEQIEEYKQRQEKAAA